MSLAIVYLDTHILIEKVGGTEEPASLIVVSLVVVNDVGEQGSYSTNPPRTSIGASQVSTIDIFWGEYYQFLSYQGVIIDVCYNGSEPFNQCWSWFI